MLQFVTTFSRSSREVAFPLNFFYKRLLRSFSEVKPPPKSNKRKLDIQKKELLRYTFEDIEEIAHHLKQKITIQPQIGIICGTGLGSVGELLKSPTIFDYNDIPKFPISTVPGHAGRLLFGLIGDVPVVCMQGRFHFYEGYPLWMVVMPVRLMKLLGVHTLIVSNAAGGINSSYHVGDIMLIKDHINLVGFAGNSPLQGPNEDRFGPRFVALNNSYDPKIIKGVTMIAKDLGLKGLHEGVYCCTGGPTFETVAELKLMKIVGADAVGMSTVHEIVTATHCGMTCLGLSLITNKCVLDYDSDKTPNHEEVLAAGKEREKDVKNLIEKVVVYLAKIKK